MTTCAIFSQNINLRAIANNGSVNLVADGDIAGEVEVWDKPCSFKYNLNFDAEIGGSALVITSLWFPANKSYEYLWVGDEGNNAVFRMKKISA